MFPGFNESVPPDGYRWWYLDAISDDGRQAITLILFVGSVFSPYYAWARRRGPARAEEYCALNVALYGSPSRWCMTERNERSVSRDRSQYKIGHSAVAHIGDALVIDIDEWAVPLPRRVRGRIHVDLNAAPQQAVALDKDGAHLWQMLAPRAPIELEFSSPGMSWTGTAYVDSNHGAIPLERSFRSWNWSRAHLEDGTTVLQYDVLDKDANASSHSYRIDADGNLTTLPGLDTPLTLVRTRWWRIPRRTRGNTDSVISNLQTLEDTPFYSRNRFDTRIDGLHASCIHESLELERFDSHWVRCLLPFRMPRNVRAVGDHRSTRPEPPGIPDSRPRS